MADTGSSSTDGITNNGTFRVTGIEPRARWQWSANAGSKFNDGVGETFTLGAGIYAKSAIQVRQIDAVGNVGDFAAGPTAMTVDLTAPTLVAFAATKTAAGLYTTGQVITITATLSEAVQDGGFITVTLNTSGTVATLQLRLDTKLDPSRKTLSGQYKIAASEKVTGALRVASFAIGGGNGGVKDIAGNDLTSLAVPTDANNIDWKKKITIN